METAGENIDQQATNRDHLTGLHDRKSMERELERLVEQEPASFSILLIDLDSLKPVNDASGHEAGDTLLIETARVLSNSVRANPDESYTNGRSQPNAEPDIVKEARIGGDEFVILLAGINDQVILGLVQDRVQQALADKGISASIGSRVHQEGENAKDILRAADELMREQKNGRKTIKFNALPRRKRVAAKIGGRLLHYAGVNPPRQ